MSFEHPSVYITTYSNAEVYECLVGDAPIMRRCKDDWVNATQILKLCDFPKAKRTKILEKGVQQGLHEKVQGGYGRFQGTWIPLKDAQALAEEYQIDHEKVPVLYIDVRDPNVTIPRKSKVTGAAGSGTPSKRKYSRKATVKETATPKKKKLEDLLPPQAVFKQDYPTLVPRSAPNMAPMTTNSKQIHGMNIPQAANAVPNEAINHHNGFVPRPATFPQFAVPDTNFAQLQQQQQIPKSYDQNGILVGTEDMLNQQIIYQQQQQQHHRPSTSHGTSTNETNWSQDEQTRDLDTSLSSAEGKPVQEDETSYVEQLLRFFSENNAPIPYFLYNPPADFNLNAPIDDEGHATLHWAAAVGNLNLVHLLLSKGASPLVVSQFGLNPLSKCIGFTNCYDLHNFAHIVAALEACLINTDVNGRTPLHYACQFLKVPLKRPALNFYLDVMLAKLRVMARNSSTGVDLMKNVLNHQDVNGDTCLHLAAQARCTQFVKFFLACGARDDLLNARNQTAKELIVQLDLLVYNFASQPQHTAIIPGTHSQQIPNGLGTPIRGFGRMVETPDTQRTTIADDDEEELQDRVSTEHLRLFMASQDNKENIFVDDPARNVYRAVSTPKKAFQQQPPSEFVAPAPKPNVLGVIAEQESSPPSPKNHEEVLASSENPKEVIDSKLPMEDVSSMVQSMMNSLLKSYKEQLSGLRAEQDRVKVQLAEKKLQDDACSKKINSLLARNAFKGANNLQDVAAEVAVETSDHKCELDRKMAQLQCVLEKLQAFDLASRVEEQESQIEKRELHTPSIDTDEKLALVVQLTKAQLRRRSLVVKLVDSIRDFAISAKMNKYRKLISLSCNLKVEDIDGLIDGIEASLNERSPQA